MSIRKRMYWRYIFLLIALILIVFNFSCAHKKPVMHGHFKPIPIPESSAEELPPMVNMHPLEALKIAGECFQEAEKLREKGDNKGARDKYLTVRRTLISGGIVPGIFRELRDDWEKNFVPESEKRVKLDSLHTWKIISGLQSKGCYSEIVIPFPLPERVLFEMEDVIKRYPVRFQEGLNRSGLYVKYIREKFSKEGLPEELCWLAMVESSFQTKIDSSSGAGGMWQFIRSTARNYGLVMDSYLDERYNWVVSTKAACNYLKFLHDFFGGDWELAISGYNMGENGLKRIIESTVGERNFWKIIETPPASEVIKEETKKYYPRFLAYIFICNDPAAYGFTPSPFSPIEWDEVDTDGIYSLSMLEEAMGYEGGKLHRWNPFLIKGLTPPYPYKLMVPKGDGEKLAQVLISPSFKGYQYANYIIKKGDNAYTIAHRHGIGVEELLKINSLRSTKELRPGMNILVPSHRIGRISFARRKYEGSNEKKEVLDNSQLPDYHEVKKGETLYLIAKKYNLRVEELARMNNLTAKDILKPNTRIRLKEGRSQEGECDGTELKKRDAILKLSSVDVNIYKVRKGDTLAKIASRYSVSVEVIKEMNGLKSDVLREGDEIKVPSGNTGLVASGNFSQNTKSILASYDSSNERAISGGVNSYHIVKKGDTISGIAQKYGVSAKYLMHINNLNENSVLRVGQKVYIAESSNGFSSGAVVQADNASGSSSEKGFKQGYKGEYIEHIVQSGDNLWNLSKKYKVDVSTIQKANVGLNPTNLKIGIKVLIPIIKETTDEKEKVSPN